MSILGICTITVIISIIFEFKNEFKMFKDIADAGYKINIDRLDELQKQLSPNATNNLLMSLLIPFYNIASVMMRRNKYENNKQLIFDQYDKLGIIEEMTEEEQKEYMKNPTGWNALVIPLMAKERKENQDLSIGTITITEPNGEVSEVKVNFNFHDDNKKIEILSAKGPISKLTYEEQLSFIGEHFLNAVKKGEEKYGSREAFLDAICKGNTANLNEALEAKLDEPVQEEIKKTEEPKPLTRLERYKQLRDSITQNGFLYGEEMVEYKELKEEFGELTLSK